MTTTQFAWCGRCKDRVELVMTEAGAYMCHKCGNVALRSMEDV